MFLKKTLQSLEKIEKQKKVGNQIKPHEIHKIFNDFKIPQSGLKQDKILNYAKNYIKFSINTGSGKFLNQLFGGRDEFAIAGELIAAYTNTTMATYEMSPVASLMEIKIIEYIADLIGFKNFDGKFVSGGSYANIAAMMCARNSVDSKIKTSGMLGKKLVAFVSKDAHYCFLKSANMLGIGSENLIKIAVDENGKMLASDLEKKILQAKKTGACPFFIAATLGTTVKGAFDNINEISLIAKKYKIWLHGDGAYGAPVIFSKKHQHLISGTQKLDSLAFDFHKILGTPLLASIVVFNNKKNICSEVFDSGSGDYIFHEANCQTSQVNSSYNQGPKSLQCGRKVDALKVWLMMLNLGKKGLEKRVNHLFDLAEYAGKKIAADPDFKILFPPSFLNICFQFLPKKIGKKTVSNFNEELRYKILNNGECFVNYSTENNENFFRLVTVNFNSSKQDIDGLLSEIKRVAKVKVR